MGIAVGIDLGTSNSCIAVIEDGKPVVIPNAEGEPITPSVVAVLEDGKVLVGSAAKRQAVLNPTGTVSSSKRFIGKQFQDLRSSSLKLNYKLEERADGGIQFNLGRKLLTPEEIGALILQKLVQDAEKTIGRKISEAVITVPAYFNDAQRQATKFAGELAGLSVTRIINEPTAAALAVGLGKEGVDKVVVFDIGGGTLDVTVLEIDETLFEVRSTSGDTYLGGDDFDQVIEDWILYQCKKVGAELVSQDRVSLQRIREAAEIAKIQLSELSETSIILPFLFSEGALDRNFSANLSRAEFDELSVSLVERCRLPIKGALRGAGLTSSQISKVVLVGGTGRIPMIRSLVAYEFFKTELILPPNTEEVIALGAAVQAGMLNGDIAERLLMDVTPFDLGIETDGGKFIPLIYQNSPIPTRGSECFTTASHFQRGADIKILQRDTELSKPHLIGSFSLDGLRGGAKGQSLVEVNFEINESGLLKVSATDRETGRSNQIEIRNGEHSNGREVKKEDKEILQLNIKNELTELIQQAEYLAEKLLQMESGFDPKTLKQSQGLRSKLSAASERRVEKKIKALSKEAEKILETFQS